VTVVGWTIRIIIILLVIRALWRLIAGVLEGLHGAPPRQRGSVPLARDPICGTFVVPGRALTSSAGDTLHYFCSEDCRRKFLGERAR
jgi:YHS domain-containing protein